MSHHFHCVLFVRSELLGPVHTQGEGLIGKQNTRRRRSLGTTFKAAYHACPFPASSEPTPRSGPAAWLAGPERAVCVSYLLSLSSLALCTFCLELVDISSAQYFRPRNKVLAITHLHISAFSVRVFVPLQFKFLLCDSRDCVLLTCGFPAPTIVYGTEWALIYSLLSMKE